MVWCKMSLDECGKHYLLTTKYLPMSRRQTMLLEIEKSKSGFWDCITSAESIPSTIPLYSGSWYTPMNLGLCIADTLVLDRFHQCVLRLILDIKSIFHMPVHISNETIIHRYKFHSAGHTICPVDIRMDVWTLNRSVLNMTQRSVYSSSKTQAR